MRKLLICISLLAMLFLPSQAGASSGSWLAQGSGLVGGTTQRWQWVATSDVGGLNVKGHFSAFDKTTGTGFEADVTCLSVSGNAARIGIFITQSTNPSRPAPSSTYITMSTTGEGNDAVNLVGADAVLVGPLLVCPPPSGMTTPFDGEINIREEATPGMWFAQGSGFIATTTQHWQWVASSDVGGGNVKGHFFADDSSTGTGFEADATCLSVLGSTARIGILIVESTEPSRPPGASTYITMSTTGQGSAALNLVGADANYPTQLTTCPPPSGYAVPFDGVINVHD
jgi:hypothetical protein